MAIFDFKAKFRELIEPYLVVIKSRLSAVSGTNHGFFLTVSSFPAEAGVNDFLVLTQDDGTNESGFYSWNGTAWGFAMDIGTFNEAVQGLFADAAAAAAGTATDKTLTVAQSVAKFAALAGSETQKFSAAAPEESTDEVTRANDFAVAISQAEAQTDWDAI